MSAQTFEFEGEQVTARQLHKRMPAYSESFLLRAMRDHGARTLADLAAIRERGHRNQRDAAKFGRKSSPWRKGLWLKAGVAE